MLCSNNLTSLKTRIIRIHLKEKLHEPIKEKMSHFFEEDSTEENVKKQQLGKKLSSKKAKAATKAADNVPMKESEAHLSSTPSSFIANLPANDKQKFTTISTYLKQNKSINDRLRDELLSIEGLPKSLRNRIAIKNKKREEEEKEKEEEEKEEDKTVEKREVKGEADKNIYDKGDEDNYDNILDDEASLDKAIGNLMEKGLQEGIEALTRLEKSISEKDGEEAINKQTIEKVLKAKLGLYNKNIDKVAYGTYKATLKEFIEIGGGKGKRVLFYVRMLLRIADDRNDLLGFLEGVEEAKKIYYDQIFFYGDEYKSHEGKERNGNEDLIDSVKQSGPLSSITYDSLDNEYKLIYLIRSDYKKAAEYFYDNEDVDYSEKILNEFILLSFKKEEFKLTTDLIIRRGKSEKVNELTKSDSFNSHSSLNSLTSLCENTLDNIIIVLEIIGFLPTNLLRENLLILENNNLMLRSKNRRMELMRAYFLCVNWDFEECGRILKREMGIDCLEEVKRRYGELV